MRLYYSPGACSLSPHIIAREVGVPVEISRVTFADGTRTTEQGENFFEVNLKGGYVPALRLDSDEVLTEGVAIAQYIAMQAPEKKLLPEVGSIEYFRVLEWMTYISSELHKGFGPLFNPSIGEEEKSRVVEKLKTRFEYINGALEGKEYVSDAFSIADVYAYTIIRWSPRASINVSDYPNIHAFMQRMETHEGVKQALSEEGLEPMASAA
jgi:glutathione S-transferase